MSRFQLAELPTDLQQQTLVIHGEADDVVPLDAVMDWARPQGLPVTVFPVPGTFSWPPDRAEGGGQAQLPPVTVREYQHALIKALHIIFVITWMAAIFYLPRLFVLSRRP